MALDGLDNALIQCWRLARDTKGAVGRVPPRTPCDLCQFIRCQVAHPMAVKLDQGRECDMLDIKVQPHTNSVRRYQIINVAVLIHLHLSVPRAGAERPHNHGGTSLCPPDQLSNCIDIINRKPDYGGSFRHPTYLFRT